MAFVYFLSVKSRFEINHVLRRSGGLKKKKEKKRKDESETIRWELVEQVSGIHLKKANA